MSILVSVLVTVLGTFLCQFWEHFSRYKFGGNLGVNCGVMSRYTTLHDDASLYSTLQLLPALQEPLPASVKSLFVRLDQQSCRSSARHGIARCRVRVEGVCGTCGVGLGSTIQIPSFVGGRVDYRRRSQMDPRL